MTATVQRDLLTVERGIIVHQVNCQGVMGAGLAKKIRDKWPIVFTQYRQAYKEHFWELGEIQLVKVAPELYVCNLAGQFSYGRSGQFTNYRAIEKALANLKDVRSLDFLTTVELSDLPVFFPYKMGCALGGGNWDRVRK